MCRSNMRAGFTLMEMMISVVLIVLITLFLSEAITSMQRSNISLKKHDDVEQNRSQLFTLLYRDLLSAKEIKVIQTKDKRFNVVQMQTMNSMYNIAYPYVVYFVNANTFNLTRLESAQVIKLPVSYEDRYYYKANELVKNVTDFNLYTSAPIQENNSSAKTKTSAVKSTRYELLYLNAKGLRSPILFEMSRP